MLSQITQDKQLNVDLDELQSMFSRHHSKLVNQGGKKQSQSKETPYFVQQKKHKTLNQKMYHSRKDGETSFDNKFSHPQQNNKIIDSSFKIPHVYRSARKNDRIHNIDQFNYLINNDGSDNVSIYNGSESHLNEDFSLSIQNSQSQMHFEKDQSKRNFYSPTKMLPRDSLITMGAHGGGQIIDESPNSNKNRG